MTLRSGLARLLAWTAFLPLAAQAQTQGPAFDCARARGEVEALICSDAALAALDRRLDQVHRAAAAQARGAMATRLRADQRAWVKGRNECWKARVPTWITASWTVATVRDCVEAQYRLRSSELQAVWRLLPPETRVYACHRQPANEVVVHAFASDPATLRLERGDRTLTLWRVGAPGAAAWDGRYEGQNIAVELKGDALALEWLDTDTGRTEALPCRQR